MIPERFNLHRILDNNIRNQLSTLTIKIKKFLKKGVLNADFNSQACFLCQNAISVRWKTEEK